MNDPTPTISTVEDIKLVLREFDPKHKNNAVQAEPVITAKMRGRLDDRSDHHIDFQASAKPSSLTHRSMLLAALKDLSERRELAMKMDVSEEPIYIDGKPMRRPAAIQTDMELPIDSVIRRVMGGYRDELDVCWDLSDGYTYRYCVFDHSLSRRKKETNDE